MNSLRIGPAVQFAALLFMHSVQAADSFAPPKEIDRTLIELRDDLNARRVTSEQLVRRYLARIDVLDRSSPGKGPAIRALIAVNPDALSVARTMDRERREGRTRGPLHGIPIVLKDNIETRDRMPTTAGSLALLENFATQDAAIVVSLRNAGAIVLGKANLSEWANFRSERSISGWSAVGGLTKNPHVLDRSACGSSAGSAAAIAATFAAAAVGTETDGSITCPASMNGVVGFKPTHGLLPQRGIVPIAHSQDTAGPMTRSVADAALMLNAMVDSESDCRARAPDCKHADYFAALSQHSLNGKRIGVWRFRQGRYAAIDALIDRALQVLRAAGAHTVEIEVPDSVRARTAEETVLFTEFKADLNVYLAGLPPRVSVRTLEQLIAFNERDPREFVLFGQELFVRAQTTKGLNDPTYKAALAEGKRAASEAIAKALDAQQLDFIVAPTNGPSWRIDIVSGDQFSGSFSSLPAISGFPHLTVPMGAVRGLPIGLSFIGRPWSESELLSAAHYYERSAQARPRAEFKATLEDEQESALREP